MGENDSEGAGREHERRDGCGCTNGRIVGTEPTCMAVQPDGHLVCTREPDHDGLHEACSPSAHPKARWSE